MALTKDERQKIVDVLANVDPDIKDSEAIALHVKFMALQTRLLADIANELDSIGRALERMTGRM